MAEEKIPDEMQEIINDFISEGKENLAELERVFVDLERDPGNLELINTVFRAAHSLKGAADFLGFSRIVAVAHRSESLLNLLRKGTLNLNAEIMDVVFAAVDMLQALLGEIESGTEDGGEIETLLGRIDTILAANTEDGGEKKSLNESQRASGDKPPAAPQPSVQVPPVDSVPSPAAMTAPADLPADQPTEATTPTPTAETKEDGPQASEPPLPNGGQGKGEPVRDQTIRVDVARLDSVMNLVGELVLARNRMIKTNQALQSRFGDDDLIQSLADHSLHLSLLTTDLQLAVLKTRMQPMRKVFSKIPRMVRDLARKKMKEIDLEISGEETEVDKSIIEEIGDPLVHMIRNSVDHGIEIPDFRGPLGKPERGVIRLSASYEGDHIIIEITDDGKGLDPAKLRSKAVEKGVLSPEDSEKISDQDSLNLIFAPGFSTAETVTNTSGRGVGMDVVKSNIARLNGIVNVESSVGEWTRFRIRLPLTVAIIQALMVGVEAETYAIPLGSVIETLRITPEDIQKVDDKEVITLRDEILPLTYLGEVLGLSGGNPGDDSYMYVVVAGVAERKRGLVVNHLHGQEEVVIKPLGNYLKGHREFAGATLTGGGQVVMILDVGGVMGAQSLVC
ncbi:MAG: chemotaxis protein CheA [bacterium]|nr:chemotaxis protein CheA [bacterium]